MGIGAILDRAFRLYRQNFVRFIAIVAIVVVPVSLLNVLLISAQVDAMLARVVEGSSRAAMAATRQLGYLMLGAALLAGIAQLLSTAALIKAVSGTYLGRRMSVGQSYSAVIGKLLPLLGFVLVMILLMIPVAIVGGLLIGVATTIHWIAVVLAMLAMLVVMLLIVLRYYLTIHAVVIENKPVFQGMTRSSTLSAGYRGKMFLLFVAIIIISVIASLAFGWIAAKIVPDPGFEDMASPGRLRETLMQTLVIRGLIELVGEILIVPIGAAAFILFYYDLRIRKEGFDLEMLAEAIGEQAPQTETPSDGGLPTA